MRCTLKEAAPGRLEIREGGGGLAVFGALFLLTGVYITLAALGVVTLHNEGPDPTRTAITLFSTTFTAAGVLLVFGRRITVLDLAEHVVSRQWRVLLPLRTRVYELANYATVTLSFTKGDSDSADSYPIGLRGGAAPPLALCRPLQYAKAREYAVAIARHLGLDVEDSTTDHAERLGVSEADAPLYERLRARSGDGETQASRPAVMRSEISAVGDAVTIVIPMPRLNPLTVISTTFPAAFALAMLAWLGFFSRTRPLTPGEWIFAGVLLVAFTIVPAISLVNAVLRSRLGRVVVTVSRAALRVDERGVLRTRTLTACAAADILGVDYSTKESVLASTRRNAEIETATLRNAPSATVVRNPAAERVVALLSVFVKGKGIVVKTRTGFTAFGDGLDDDEIRYLYGVVQGALSGRNAL